MKDRKELMNELLDNTTIPALSFAWSQKGKRHAVAHGKTDTLAPKLVDKNTLFQAASLSKPVSAAIFLDWVAQSKWKLDTKLVDIGDYGPPELKKDPHYPTLTIGMVIGQCSGLANFGDKNGSDGKNFIATPNTRFTYSGVAFDFLKQLVEKDTNKQWEELAQDFFKKAHMTSSTFVRQLPNGQLHGIQRDIAMAHIAKPFPNGPLTSLPPLREDEPGIPAGSMLTTAEDYITFLQYCYENEYLKSTLLKGALSTLPPTSSPENSQIQWGLGMGIYNNKNPQQTIAFHWGSNTGSFSFCAMDMKTGDCVVCFANSNNGPSVFQHVAEPIVGNMQPLFKWLYDWCEFRNETPAKEPNAVATTVQSIHELEKAGPSDKCQEITNTFKLSIEHDRSKYIAPPNLSQENDPPPTETPTPWKQ